MPATPAPDLSADALAWAQRLVRFNTVSRESNLPLIECIADHLRGLGVPLRLSYDDTRRKANLFATVGEGQPGGVVLSGHTDTVPWDGQAWSVDPLGAELRTVDGEARLYGRGSADMKAFIGLVVAHTRRFQEADAPQAIHYAFSYDEEVGCLGARTLLADLRDAGLPPAAMPRLTIVGEPTMMQPAVAHKGVARWRCCVKGRAAHSSQTHLGVNAIEAAARLVAEVADLADGFATHGPFHPGFEVPHTSAAVGVIAGGIADNVIPEDCRFHYEFRALPGTDVAALQRRVTERAAALQSAMRRVDPASGIRFETICEVPPFQAPPGDAAVALVQRLLATDHATLVGFGTEAGLFQAAGLPSVVCGPGSIDEAHQADEYVSLAQLARCERLLADLARGA